MKIIDKLGDLSAVSLDQVSTPLAARTVPPETPEDAAKLSRQKPYMGVCFYYRILPTSDRYRLIREFPTYTLAINAHQMTPEELWECCQLSPAYALAFVEHKLSCRQRLILLKKLSRLGIALLRHAGLASAALIGMATLPEKLLQRVLERSPVLAALAASVQPTCRPNSRRQTRVLNYIAVAGDALHGYEETKEAVQAFRQRSVARWRKFRRESLWRKLSVPGCHGELVHDVMWFVDSRNNWYNLSDVYEAGNLDTLTYIIGYVDCLIWIQTYCSKEIFGHRPYGSDTTCPAAFLAPGIFSASELSKMFQHRELWRCSSESLERLLPFIRPLFTPTEYTRLRTDLILTRL